MVINGVKLNTKDSDSEIKNISINYSKSSLTPEFSSRVLNYTLIIIIQFSH